MLIFSQFTSMLALLEEALHDAGLQTLKLTGETDKIERMALVEQFNSGDIPVFLISLKAGGTGLNLTGADVVIHYDPWWNTAARNQATDRAYRIGQTKGVQVFDLIAADTIEERIVAASAGKESAQRRRAFGRGLAVHCGRVCASGDLERVKFAASIRPAQASGCWRAYGAAAAQRVCAASR